ncbi:unnamed protein product [Psylliodes chrysocephalus]|uniref:Arf-GAP domain-containing protein n=1 Tax=Psylliodes chrysocephalus TaxID=3402493 RepID=A0A9P0DBZ8_9CUCU|nr:unnamed protein product [Psylliodes chrysocephala]
MASSRRKQDEKNLKTLRELGALPLNKYCFDCNQRGPTYVNVTIGSFVCTKCSGMLRGITPPHRVKSISMATFTNEEIDILKSRGNDYCRQVWLGLYEGTPPSTNGDETSIRDFMIEKYEKRRYYLDPVNVKPVEECKAPKINGIQVLPTQRPRPEVNRNNNATRNSLNNLNINNINNTTITNNMQTNGFVADFDRADIFTGAGTTITNGITIKGQQQHHHQNDFANFDNNAVFNSSSIGSNATPGLPIPATFNNNGWNKSNTSANLNGSLNSTNGTPTLNGTAAPVEDRYAALKDLDNEFKTQKNGSVDWTSSANSSSSNGSLYSSPTPTGSVYSSPSSHSSIFGSPSQGQFMTAFPSNQDPNIPEAVSNPFNMNGGAVNWSNVAATNGMQSVQQQQQQPFANPFRDTVKSNGYTNNFQPIAFPTNGIPLAVNGTNGWTPNPFKVGGPTAMNSNNPFL